MSKCNVLKPHINGVYQKKKLQNLNSGAVSLSGVR